MSDERLKVAGTDQYLVCSPDQRAGGPGPVDDRFTLRALGEVYLAHRVALTDIRLEVDQRLVEARVAGDQVAQPGSGMCISRPGGRPRDAPPMTAG